ncbi:hypothetical protein PQX77_002965 [Marasmius sp. AFHP31]|nr:hypothetical protein PQX77_002965 [Marasmius sp. AFHP31]
MGTVPEGTFDDNSSGEESHSGTFHTNTEHLVEPYGNPKQGGFVDSPAIEYDNHISSPIVIESAESPVHDYQARVEDVPNEDDVDFDLDPEGDKILDAGNGVDWNQEAPDSDSDSNDLEYDRDIDEILQEDMLRKAAAMEPEILKGLTSLTRTLQPSVTMHTKLNDT